LTDQYGAGGGLALAIIGAFWSDIANSALCCPGCPHGNDEEKGL